MEIPRIALNIEEAAVAIGVTTETVEQLVRDNQIPCFRLGGSTLIPVKCLGDWVEAEALQKQAEYKRVVGS